MDYNDPFSSGLFGTTVDPYAANFGNPMNPANMNPGFGINPALLTPSYTANYRPQVNMPSGYSPYGDPSFGRAAVNAFGPYQDPTWGNPVDSMQPSARSLGTKPFDAMAWAGQNIALPYMAYTGAARILGPLTGSGWSFMSNLGSVRGMSNFWRGGGVAARAGGRFGLGLAEGLGMAGKARQVMGGLGALTAGTLGPLALGYAAYETANNLVFDQYRTSRINAQKLQENFGNVYMGGNDGNTITGKGFSGYGAAVVGNQINSLGNNDRMFSRDDYSSIADLSGKAGLLDQARSGDITKKIKDISSVIKVFAAIANDPNVETALQELSKLNKAGASLIGGSTGYSQAGSALQNLGSYAAQSGYSLQRLMNGVGAQGQYLFQANGMTPYLGQLAAANSLAGFSAAQRTGLLSASTLARSGGIEGLTQGSLTAQVLGSQTPYAMMGAYNRFVNGTGGTTVGGAGQSVTSTVAAFGAGVSGDPLSALGKMALYGKAAAGADLKNQGSMGLENQAVSILRSMNVAPGAPGGKYTPEQIAAVMKHQMGIPDDNIRDYILQRSSETDPGTYKVRRQAIRGQAIEQAQQFINQNGIGGGPIDSAVRSIKDTWMGLSENAHENLVAPVVEAAGSLSDMVGKASNYWNYGRSTESRKQYDSNVFEGNNDTKLSLFRIEGERDGLTRGTSISRSAANIAESRGWFDKSTMGYSQVTDFFKHVNDMAKSGDPESKKKARAILEAKSEGDIRKAVEDFARSNPGKYGALLDSRSAEKFDSNMSTIVNTIKDQGDTRDSYDVTSEKQRSEYDDKVFQNYSTLTQSGASKTGGAMETYNIGAALSIQDMLQTKGSTAEGVLEYLRKDKSGKYSSVLSELGGDKATSGDLVKWYQKAVAGGAAVGNLGLSRSLFNGSSIEDILKDPKKALAAAQKANGNQVYDAGGALSTDSAKAMIGHADQLAQYTNQALTADQQNSDIYDQYVNGKVDYRKVQETYGKIDSSTRFSMAVDKFAAYIDKQTGTPKSTPAASTTPSANKVNTTGFRNANGKSVTENPG